MKFACLGTVVFKEVEKKKNQTEIDLTMESYSESSLRAEASVMSPCNISLTNKRC